MNSLKKLFDVLDRDPNLIRLQELEKVLDNRNEIKDLIHKKQEISKQMMNSKVIGLKNAYKDFKEQYDKINNDLLDFPFVCEYIDLLDYYNQLLSEMISYLETKINNGLKK